MKRNNLLVVALVSIATIATAQLHITANGNVQAGGYASGNFAQKLTVNGTIGFQSWTPVIGDNTGDWGNFCLYPQNENYQFQLGKTNRKIGTMYVGTGYFQSATILTIYNNNWIKSFSTAFSRSSEPMGSMLDKINKLNTLSGQSATTETLSKDGTMSRPSPKMAYGIAIDDIRKVFPELIYEIDSANVGVSYSDLIPILLQSIKEQQVIISKLSTDATTWAINDSINRGVNQQLLANANYLELKIEHIQKSLNLTALGDENIGQATSLEQNYPNPFNKETVISYFVPQNASAAQLMIFDMTGLLVKTYDSIQKGKASIAIEASQLKAGMYMYSLIVDGQEVDTKKMILSK